MLIPTSLPTIYDLTDPESNLASALFVAADGTPLGVGNSCSTPAYLPSTALDELREKEVWSIVLAGASLYLGWVLFFGKRTQGKDKHYGSMI